MPKHSSYISRFLLVMTIGLLIMSLTVFALSNYFFTQVSFHTLRQSMRHTLATGEKLLSDYHSGVIDREELKEKADPVFNSSGDFLLLLDSQGKALAYTDGALPYFAANEADELIEQLLNDENPP